jgi:hypothetical protein
LSRLLENGFLGNEWPKKLMFLGTFNLLKWRTIAQFFSPNLVTLAAATIRKKLLTHGETPENLSTLQNNEIRIRFTYWLHY